MVQRLFLVLGLAGLAAGRASAQSTGTPVFSAPYRAFKTNELGVSLSDPGGPGWALEGFYHRGWRKFDVGFRGGFMDFKTGPTLVLIGADFRARVLTYSESFPLDGAVTVGLGGNFGGGQSTGIIPLGISLGRRIQLEGSHISFVPYAHPVISPTFGNGGGDVLFTLGLGVDVQFTQSIDLRVNGGLGDLDGVSVSVAFLR